MAFWRGETIAAQGDAIVSPFDKNAIDCNAYTLSMGDLWYCTSDGVSPKFSKPETLEDGDIFVIPPGQFAFLRTKETVTIPDTAMAFISMKATFKFEGLINVSGFHVDPGYHGRLLFSTYNAGPSHVYLREGMGLFLIWFADLDQKTQKTRTGGEKELSTDLVRKMGPILSLQSVSEAIYKIEFKVTVQYTIFAFAVAFFTAIFFALFSHWLDTPASPSPPRVSVQVSP